jgi:hypothetical protein
MVDGHCLLIGVTAVCCSQRPHSLHACASVPTQPMMPSLHAMPRLGAKVDVHRPLLSYLNPSTFLHAASAVHSCTPPLQPHVAIRLPSAEKRRSVETVVSDEQGCKHSFREELQRGGDLLCK